MFESQTLHQKILEAIDVSEKIIVSLQRGNLKQAEYYDSKRAQCVRALSRCQSFEALVVPYMTEIDKLTELDKSILLFSQNLRDEVLTEIRLEQTNRVRHIQYAQNQQL